MKDAMTLPAVRVELTLDDGTVLARDWTMNDPSLGDLRATLMDPPAWFHSMSKAWDHPQDPVTFRALVQVGHEDDARALLEMSV